LKIGTITGSSYRHLPPNFPELYESVWVDLDTSLLEADKMNLDYNDNLDICEAADRAGFDVIAHNEHHASGFTITPSPNLMTAALARRTSRAALLVLGNSIALYNPPTRVAEEIAMLDNISGGRMIAGFPIGTPMDACFAYGINPSELRQRYYEAHDIIIKAWKSDKRFSYNGRFNQIPNVNVVPKPIQDPHPPVWIPAGGSPETWDFCAKNDYMYNYLTYFGYMSAEKTVRGFWDAMKRVGKEPNPYAIGTVQYVGMAESYEEAVKLYKEPAEYLFNVAQHIAPRWGSPPGYITEKAIRVKMEAEFKERGVGAAVNTQSVAWEKWSFERLVADGYILLGTPEQVSEKLRAAAKKMNVGNWLLQVQWGNMDAQTALYNTEQCGKMIPYLKELFTNEWEHRWWPKPMQKAARPAELVMS
jgi:alkanesulfonate monooxygenase SsuD/methylene tetrahydromethanopterin reductase-like flavin-dependent oxidoreductase (luciferase family)